MFMTVHRLLSLILLAALCIFAMEITPVSHAQSDDVQSLTTRLDALLAAHWDNLAIPGLAIAIVPQGGEAPILRGYGQDGRGRAVDADTQFYIASASKSFTALAIVQLVERGQLDLDATVQSLIPQFTTHQPVLSDRITVRHLLHHLSGLSDEGYPEQRLPVPPSLAALVDALANADMSSEPGTQFRYFNPNYSLLGRIVEVVSGQSYAGYLTANIFAPLGMNSTTVIPNDALRLAQGHVVLWGLPLPARPPVHYQEPAGGIITTACDMSAYLRMQMDGGRYGDARLLSEAGIRTLHMPRTDLDLTYGMGWEAYRTSSGDLFINHMGDLPGFHTEMGFLPEQGTGFVLLINRNHILGGANTYTEMVDNLIALLKGAAPMPAEGLSARWVGGLFGLAFLLLVLWRARQFLRLQAWGQQMRAAPRWRQTVDLALPLGSVLLALTFPMWVEQTRGRAVTWSILFDFFPDGVVWLLGAAASGAALALLRLYQLVVKPSQRGT
jgi:CubicO group peptidase (beta-lactamase class C family)